MRKSIIITGISALAIFGASSPAWASDPTPVNINATITIQDVVTLANVASNVPLGTGAPGQTVTKTGAEVPHIQCFHSAGCSYSIQNQNGGWHVALGQPDVIDNTALSINGTSLVHTGSTLLDTIPAGSDADYSEDWALNIPTNVGTPGDLNAQYTYSLIAK